ncbi:trypsin-like serine peptidase [Enterococcus sp. DIV1758]|uniref:trypsin-like serine peptidase n=1 Tax=Enterococcus sp. DIV1758 TaxID=2774744 RepID=UPI003F207358
MKKSLLYVGLFLIPMSMVMETNLGVLEAHCQENTTTVQDSATKSIRSILGEDERSQIFNTKVAPYNSIVWIAGASGAVIGENTVLTAAHVVRRFYDSPSNIDVIPGRNGNGTPYGKFKAKAVYIPDEYLKKANANFDYAIVTVESNNGQSIGSKIPILPIKLTNIIGKGTALSTAGYPGDKPRGTLWESNGHVVSEDSIRLKYDMDTAGGQSGSPIFNENHEIIGVHTNGGKTNSGVKLNTNIYQFILNYLS